MAFILICYRPTLQFLSKSMPFKLKLIKEYQKNINSMKEKQSNSKIQSQTPDNQSPKIKNKQKKKLISRNFNLFQLALIKQPQEMHHVVNFFNIIGVNEQAIFDPNFDQSLFATVFYIKNIVKVQVKANYVLFHLGNSTQNFPPLEYIIERFQSYGDIRFYNLANSLIEAASKLKAIEQYDVKQKSQDNNEILQRYTESLGNKMFTFRSTINKLVISRSLLDLLEFDVNDFALQAIKYKAPLCQFLSSEKYFDVIYLMIQNLKNVFDLLSDKISLESFLDSSIIRFKDYIYTKSNKKIYCKLKMGMPNPMVNLMQVEEIINRSEQYFFQRLQPSVREQQINKIKQEKQISQINSLRNIITLPKNLLPQNIQKVTSYCAIVKEPITISNQ